MNMYSSWDKEVNQWQINKLNTTYEILQIELVKEIKEFNSWYLNDLNDPALSELNSFIREYNKDGRPRPSENSEPIANLIEVTNSKNFESSEEDEPDEEDEIKNGEQ